MGHVHCNVITQKLGPSQIEGVIKKLGSVYRVDVSKKGGILQVINQQLPVSLVVIDSIKTCVKINSKNQKRFHSTDCARKRKRNEPDSVVKYPFVECWIQSSLFPRVDLQLWSYPLSSASETDTSNWNPGDRKSCKWWAPTTAPSPF